MEKKIFKTLEEQITILKDKGLIINNETYTKEILLRENYFFLNGYRYPFLKSTNNQVYIPGTTFEELYSLFLFDRKLRNVIFKNILIVENNIKSIIAYQLSKKYGYKEKNYLNPTNFNTSNLKKQQVNDLINKMKRQIKSNATHHSATKHYIERYGYIPFWVLVKVLSFGIISELFSILKPEDQYEILDTYGLDSDTFINYLALLSNYRNLCAHEDIVYDNRTQKIIGDTKYHRLLKIDTMDNEYVYGKNDVFSVLIILKTLLKEEEVNDLMIEIQKIIDNLEYNLKTIPIDKILDRMGLPSNWIEIKDIKKEDLF